jgi:hypothetical protein
MLSSIRIYHEGVFMTCERLFAIFFNRQHSDRPPSVIVATTGLQLLKTRNTTDLLLEEYKRNITHLVQAIDSLAARNTQVLWKLMEAVDVTKLKNDNKRINNNDIDLYNKAAVEVSSLYNVFGTVNSTSDYTKLSNFTSRFSTLFTLS